MNSVAFRGVRPRIDVSQNRPKPAISEANECTRPGNGVAEGSPFVAWNKPYINPRSNPSRMENAPMARKNPPKATRSIPPAGCPYTEEEIEGMAQRHEGHGAGLVHLEGMVR